MEDDRIAYVLIDKTKPTVQIISISNRTAITTENLTAVWSSSDAISGIADHRIRLDNGSWSDVGLKTQWNLTDLTQGVHTMEVLAIDNAGNTNASVVWFQVDGKGIDIPPGGDGLLIATVIAIVVIIAVGLYALYRKKT